MKEIDIQDRPLRVGLLINPKAGMGGPAGLKGSDAIENVVDTTALIARAEKRSADFFAHLQCPSNCLTILTASGCMGGNVASSSGYSFSLVDYSVPVQTQAQDTIEVTGMLLNQGIDILLFVGGDGTARDVCSVVGTSIPVLGIPSGVKMHSGVFAINPHSAAEVVKKLAFGELIHVEQQEVRDIDEEAFRNGVVKSRFYGEMLVPFDDQFVQAVKMGGGEPDELALADLAEEIKERITDLDEACEQEASSCLFIFAPGSTTRFIQRELQCEGSLLGVDIVQQGALVATDVSSTQLESVVNHHNGPIKLILTAIGGQGHILGRGNQQLTPAVLKRIGRDNIWVVSTARKLHALNNKPLLLDTNDSQLDQSWSGLIPVVTGYQKQVLYRVSD